MDKVSKDVWGIIFSYCSVADWGNCSLAGLLPEKIEHLDVVKQIFLRAGGHPSQKFDTAKEYRQRIFERLRFAYFLDNPQIGNLAPIRDVFETHHETTLVAMGRADWCHVSSLAQAGMPDCFFTCYKPKVGFARPLTLIWNGRTGKVLQKGHWRLTDYRWIAAFVVNHEPRLAYAEQKWDNDRGFFLWGLSVINPTNGVCIVSRQIPDCKQALWNAGSLVYFADGARCPELVVRLADGTIIRMDAATLKEKGRHTFKPYSISGYPMPPSGMCDHLYVWNKQLLVRFTEELVPLDLENWTFGRKLIANAFDIGSVQVADRTYFVNFRDYERPPGANVFGYKTNIPVSRDDFRVIGGHWGDHDYLIFWPKVNVEQPYFYVWRDDDTVKEIDGRELYSRLTIKTSDFGEISLNSYDESGVSIIALSDGFALYSNESVQPTILRARPPPATPATYGRTRLFLIAGLTVLALGILANRWLRPFGR